MRHSSKNDDKLPEISYDDISSDNVGMLEWLCDLLEESTAERLDDEVLRQTLPLAAQHGHLAVLQ